LFMCCTVRLQTGISVLNGMLPTPLANASEPSCTSNISRQKSEQTQSEQTQDFHVLYCGSCRDPWPQRSRRLRCALACPACLCRRTGTLKRSSWKRERNASHRVSRRKCSRGLVLLAQTEKLLPCPICRAEKWVQFVVAELPEAKPDRISCFSVSTCARRGRSTPLTPTPSLPCAPFFSGHLNCVLDACSPVAIALLGAERSVNKTSSAGNG
jgi:hypothetical protein